MKILANLAARMVLIWLFAQFGWMTFQLHGVPIDGFGQYLLFAIVGGILLTILGFILIIPYAILASIATVLTLGLFVLVADTAFVALLIWAISALFPENLVLHGFWLTVLCALILAAASSVVEGMFGSNSES